MGAHKMEALSLELEQLGNAGKMDRAADLVAALEHAFARIRARWKRYAPAPQ